MVEQNKKMVVCGKELTHLNNNKSLNSFAIGRSQYFQSWIIKLIFMRDFIAEFIW